MTYSNFQEWIYPLGLFASLFFTLRFFIQWILSEKKKMSHVTSLFWKVSLMGNVLMVVHSFIQLQFPVLLLQTFNALIAWRNLNLMGKNALSFKKTLLFMNLTLIIFALVFIGEALLLKTFIWMRSPFHPEKNLSLIWHLLGLAGMSLFASRFWIQWWSLEKAKKSTLNKSFWWASLSGASISLIYFIELKDLVNVLGYSLGLIPYIRNLVLLKRKQNPTNEDKIFIFAGEQSGDELGVELLKDLRKIYPKKTFFGVGGPKMRSEGFQSLIEMEAFQVMGFSSVLKALFRLYFNFQKIKKAILLDPPKVVILIDYQDFNMRLEKALRKGGYKGKIVHYVSPSVWAWRKKRADRLAKHVDLLLTLFPFEKKYYEHTKLQVVCVGHPLVKTIENYPYKPFQESSLFSIFPGSRQSEIAFNLPLELEVAKKVIEKKPHTKIAISVARKELEKPIVHHLKAANIEALLVPSDFRYELMKASDAALATSGTITLELALHKVPTLVIYKISLLNYFIGKYLFRIILPFYCIVNILCKEEVFPEFIEKKLSPQEIFRKLDTFMKEKVRVKCEKMKKEFLDSDSSKRAADAIVALFDATIL